jgi:hypothetical protein
MVLVDLDDGPWDECWNCGGEGYICDCLDEIGCVDPENGCDLCMRGCSVCNGKGGWPEPENVAPPSLDGGAEGK